MSGLRVRYGREAARGLALFGLLLHLFVPFAVAAATPPGLVPPANAGVLCLSGQLAQPPSLFHERFDVEPSLVEGLSGYSGPCQHCTLNGDLHAVAPSAGPLVRVRWLGATSFGPADYPPLYAAYTPFLGSRGPPDR